MIENLLKEQGAKYGDLSVHDGLFIALCKTQESLVKRMALLPRYMEANGLDANAHIIQKLQKEGGDKELIGALNVILQEKISHVSKGDKWFKFACKQLNINPSEYINIIQTLYPNSFKTSRELNEADRLKAGFSKEELEMIKKFTKVSKCIKFILSDTQKRKRKIKTQAKTLVESLLHVAKKMQNLWHKGY